ncbi:MAG: alcohol dehydrogenase [Candidatus Fluviicola riflensis]|nr:MAG: alcohol dehydrogenase [Candidatus Fluviicola riflensis]OGS78921.1 MAG: alcohol dehydrogenase [Candidatus Fluviicola riflensis]OGS85943.1 MAG: alcohol dehydrogenase [Fluviicola sp. RIFCSPHIGHO2_12_FULL_43_24]OGS86352.1 MAG: alcohol dehydrogenase [Fluviicola sp. RIFCSPHIGHO2_01_FULL_43_53]
MKAFTKIKYGGPEILCLEEVAFPELKEAHLIVKIFANSANPADWHILRGKPFFARFTFGLFKPKEKILGADFAGIVEQVGKNVSQFKVGDKVFGESLEGGAFAEYACVAENICAKMPDGTTFSDMACLPIAGLTALQALTTHGQVKKGETVLINGASGGVGHFAVQIAKELGATVTAVSSSKNVDFVKSLGADHVIAYDKENIHQHTGKYDLIVDTNGNLSFQDYKRMGQRGVMIGFTSMGHMISVLAKKAFSKFPLIQFTAEANKKDLDTLAYLIKGDKIKVHIDKTFSSERIPEAISYIEAMRTRGKVSMIWGNVDAEN